MSEPLLVEIGCEEIPARMIAAGGEDLRSRLVGILDQAGLAHGPSRAWGGCRRLAVRVDGVEGEVAAREETVLGPPAAAAFGPGGVPTAAGSGFARKQGIDPSALLRVETDKGVYAGFTRRVPGRPIASVLAESLHGAVAGMSFPKTMRWGSGAHRWVRPVHWILALHGATPLSLEVLGVRSAATSDGHRFLAPGPVRVDHPDRYVEALRGARVLVDPAERRAELTRALATAAATVGGAPVPDAALLEEVADLVEWPGVVVGRFDPSFLELPREILVTTLRHHQKSFSIQKDGGLIPAFLSVANTDRDPGGHVRRGNEWVVVGRLDDARFFWNEDRKRPLASRVDELKRVTFHKKLGSYAEKAERVAALARAIARRLGLPAGEEGIAVEASLLAKTDLVTGLVGEFPELQGIVGGLLLSAEGSAPALAQAVAGHYKPVGADDSVPESALGSVVGLADRLDTIAGLIGAGESATGSRDPFGLRRAASGAFRILAERGWPVTMTDLFQWSGQDTRFYEFMQERLGFWLMERGSTANEIETVRRPKVSPTDFDGWPVGEILKRLESVRTLRGRADFTKLVELTKRVDNILAKQPEVLEPALTKGVSFAFSESAASAVALERTLGERRPRIEAASAANDFRGVIEQVAAFVGPVESFFDDVLVLDPSDPAATRARCDLLARVRSAVTRDFDIRELAGQAETSR
jgi:glycyl-tRNA synthetase beta chain